ncbi:CDP-glucose 4,6-dehydratase [Microvirga subterranea]|uniref:CDP-glucose 4,6-dehydratase n=1 Tax=Microvirga subterranea TaxID=186651 RepID=A0A370HCN4_9HYPH|nr:CDP-glucose 4,6-dehydratase [Microvirga subterranea]RDI54842.1 CDP-glucose 4,6-dehydratase [Microvirga subterranea]
MISTSFWAGRRVLLTGHTGFKGSWLAFCLDRLGAEVFGFALTPETQPNLFTVLPRSQRLTSWIGDIQDEKALADAVETARPSIVIHMAAQALVRRSYRAPCDTVQANVTGTVNLLEALRGNDAVMAELDAILVVTTDKVYRNAESGQPFQENSPLGGHDPYSASKAAAEILTESWARSFFTPAGVPVATARAGNVVGGGDWSEDRLIPDLWRAVKAGETAVLRNPAATRPWQLVLEPLYGYLGYIEALTGPRGSKLPRALNFGPAAGDILTVSEASDIVLTGLGSKRGWALAEGAQPHEAAQLALDAGLAERTLGWRAKLDSREALRWSTEWYRAFDAGRDMANITSEQIDRYEALT